MKRLEALKVSGNWFADKRWREPAYIANSPFTADEHEEIFEALQRVYTPRRARRIATRTTVSHRFLPANHPPLPWP
jgi:hypothetical protein